VESNGVPGTGPEGAAAGGPPAPGPGLVRLETSGTAVLPSFEQDRIRDAQRRGLRLYKSISCAGDLLRVGVDDRGRRLSGIFGTLTYRPDVEWSPGQVSGLMRHLRQWCARRSVSLRLVWVAEQHKSGRVHYHFIAFLPRWLSLPKPDKAGWWPHGMTQLQRLRKQSVGYLIKYATKCGEVAAPWPKGCRLHGHAGLDGKQRQRRTWWVLPKYIREQCTEFMCVRRAKGGGWLSPVTGQWWPAWCGPYQQSPVGAGVVQ